MYSCRIVCTSNLHGPISLEHGKTVNLGRGPVTKIKDPRLSRNHIEIIPDCQLGFLKVKLLGSNRCKAGGESLRQNQTIDVKHGDVIELLENLHHYRVEFTPVPNYSGQPCVPETDSEMVGKQTTLNHFLKRKDPGENVEGSSPAKKKKEGETWEEIDSGKLIVYTSSDIQAKSKIAAFDLDGTIITTQSGKVFPTNCQDWKLNLSQVPGKLKQLVKDDFKVVFFTNQAGLTSGKVNPAQFRDKLRSIGDKLGIPIQVFIAPTSGIYRKPAIGMWTHLIDNANESIPVDVSSSFYCGDAAGRQEKWAPGKKKDHSSVDRLFALNIGLKFYTPEEYFLGHKPVPFKEPEFNPKSLPDGSTPPLDPPDTPLFVKDQQEVILLVGFPASGKSRFASQHALQSNYQVINRDTLGTWQKCASAMEKCLDKGQSVVIDNTNPDKESRSRFIRIATARRLPCRCFIMNVSLTHAQHNNKFRELTNSNHATVSGMIYNVYKSKYEEPSTDEGFSQIVKVNFLPQFTSVKEECLYKMFLLEH